MTKKVIGDLVHEDTTKTYTRADAERELSKLQADLPRWERQLGVTQTAIDKNKADTAEWQAMLTALPKPPEREPVADPIADNPALVG
jgi:hypothetical protein